jgi:hypothetical protein
VIDEKSFDARFDDKSFDARFSAVWGGAPLLGAPTIPWTERSYAGVLDPN